MLTTLAILGLAVLAFVRLFTPLGTDASNTAGLSQPPAGQLWHYQCIDTMKDSRDSARQFTGDMEKAKIFIHTEVSTIKSLGATCVAIGTPYDQEFVSLLSWWAEEVHKQGMQVWFRGNFSGWEGWFDYPKLANSEEHHKLLKEFVLANPNLFAEGDILSPAPEAENGILGNPWRSWEARADLKNFALKSSETCQQAISQIKKKVHCGYFSANGDVAREIYDRATLEKAGRVTVIDHYVASSEKMGQDLDGYFQKHGLPIFVGEFGAPIPDINGEMTEDEQAKFVQELLLQFYYHQPNILGINYWVLNGGTTELLHADGTLRKAGLVLKSFFKPGVVRGQVKDELGRPIAGVKLGTSDGIQTVISNSAGKFYLSIPAGRLQVYTQDLRYTGSPVEVEIASGEEKAVEIRVKPIKPSLWYRTQVRLKGLLP